MIDDLYVTFHALKTSSIYIFFMPPFQTKLKLQLDIIWKAKTSQIQYQHESVLKRCGGAVVAWTTVMLL